MSRKGDGGDPRPDGYDVSDVLEQLEALESTVDSTQEKREVERTRRMLERVPGSETIRKYTSRDIAEGVVGGIVFSLPLLVEDGVFEIAAWFLTYNLGPIPILLACNVFFIVGLVVGLLYYTDIREVQFRLLFGLIPKRPVGILVTSFTVAAVAMLLWGRLHEEDPTTLEAFARVTVIWAASALGATLGDILPGESKGDDLVRRIEELGDDYRRR